MTDGERREEWGLRLTWRDGPSHDTEGPEDWARKAVEWHTSERATNPDHAVVASLLRRSVLTSPWREVDHV